MTESTRITLFGEMDRIADAVRENNPELRESLSNELQLEFRQLQKCRMPELSRKEFLDVFHVWRDHYLARLEVELSAARRRMAENDCELRRLIAERDRHKPPDKFVCKCGAVIADPLDPRMLELHGPHFVAASLPRVHEGLERWRAHYARQLK